MASRVHKHWGMYKTMLGTPSQWSHYNMTNMSSYVTIHHPASTNRREGHWTQISLNPGPILVTDWARDAHSLSHLATVMQSLDTIHADCPPPPTIVGFIWIALVTRIGIHVFKILWGSFYSCSQVFLCWVTTNTTATTHMVQSSLTTFRFVDTFKLKIGPKLEN